MMLLSLYCIILNWNLKEDTIACVDSLLAAGAYVSQIVVVDNGSTDGSQQALRDKYGAALHLLENEQNLGFAAGNNVGIEYALKQGAEWILLLNNDTVVAPTFLNELEKAVEQNSQFSIFAPLILYYDAPKRIWYLGDRLIPGTLATFSLYREKDDKGKLSPLIPVDFVSGCGVMVKRQVFDSIGMFDPDFFMYGEDADFCWRARLSGFQLACVPPAKMWHKVSLSANRDRPAARYWRIRNQISFYQRYARGFQIFFMIMFTFVRAILIALGDLIHQQPRLIAPLLRGWINGWMERPELSTGDCFYGDNKL